MVARLEAYSYYKPETDEVFFCDADCLFINKLSLPYKKGNGIYLSQRQEDFKLNHNYPEYYEEFVNKTANQVMPFLFGALATIKGMLVMGRLPNPRAKIFDLRLTDDHFAVFIPGADCHGEQASVMKDFGAKEIYEST